MKRLLVPVVLLLILAAVVTPAWAATVTIASLSGSASPAPCVFTGDSQFCGSCVQASAAGTVTSGTGLLKIFQGSPTGTVQMSVYQEGGSVGSGCTIPPTPLLTSSGILNFNTLSTSYQNFTFSFSQGIAVTANQLLAVGFTIGTGTNLGGGSNPQVSAEANGVTSTSQRDIIFDGVAWHDFGQCTSLGACTAYSLTGTTASGGSQPGGSAPPVTVTDPFGFGIPVAYAPGPPVGASQLAPTFNVPQVNGLPFIYIFGLLFMGTIGPYLLFAKRQRRREYEIHIA